MRQKKSLVAMLILTLVTLGCVQSLTAQTQQEPAKATEPGQAPSVQQPTGSVAPAPADQQKPKKLNPFTGNPDAIKEGRQLYLQNGCPGCHGSGGGGAMAGATPFIRDSWKFGGDDDTYFKVIKGTYPGQTMPGVFGANLTDEQTWKIIAWIRSIYKGDPERIVW
ncbi:mxaG (cytochrome c1) involved in methanol dehydrogenase (mxaG3) [Candidatus Methylomirabilis lanthanidiphila]|uniref:MxaG (Cytochrome c1) involved in methanol dehydrogenase (MxaG3) n=1 Tax=Candidatus Methylomirabilis lanthanidiphila TaxID=2211376 RepID=A0A564ZGR7_9BACT|nr:c-type cytochrome [Candidatus Methylomirabilis lanthanidiphila]VUZ84541.1 mxaG (cytochrome c1) involved in methanol dehydrogenase (mxaG3) [Candidatus Methylomirabilis lanthanidiphila]